MSFKDSEKVMLEVQASMKDDWSNDLLSAMESVDRSFKETNKEAEELGKTLTSVWGVKKVKQYQEAQEKSAASSATYQTALKNAAEKIYDVQKKRIKDLEGLDAEKDKAAIKAIKDRSDKDEKRIRLGLKNAKILNEKEQKGASSVKKNLIEHEKTQTKRLEIGKGLVKGVGAGLLAKDMPGAISGVSSLAGKGVSNLAKGATAAGAEMGGGLGNLLKGLGPIIAGLGLIVGSFAAIVKLVIDSDAAMKELNRDLLEAGMSGQDLVNGMGDFNTAINTVRKTFIDWDLNRAWGTTAKDHLAIIGQYAEAGMSFERITQYASDATKKTEALKNATVGVLTYTKLLGVSTADIVGITSEYMEGLGMSLQGVEERLSAISAVAKESGFSTKKFFGIVLQLTSGLSMYNVRVGETMSLLSGLSKILGKKAGADMATGLVKGFTDMSTKERFIESKKIGAERLQQWGGMAADKGMEDMIRKLSDSTSANASEFQNILKDFLKADVTQVSPKDLMQIVGKKSQEEINLYMEKLRKANPDLARNFQNTIEQTKASQMGGDAGGAEVLRTGGPKVALLANIYKTMEVTGKTIDQFTKIDIPGLIAREQLAGKSGVAIAEDVRVAEGMNGLLSNILDYQKEIAKAETPAGKMAMQKKFNSLYMKSNGIALSADGKLISATLDANGELDEANSKAIAQNIAALVMAEPEISKDQKDALTKDQELAKNIVDNTTEMTKLLQQGVEVFMSGIYDSIGAIKRWFFGGLDPEEKKLQQKAVDDISDEISKIQGDVNIRKENIKALKTQLTDETTPERKKELEAKIAAEEAAIKRGQGGMSVLRAQQKSIGEATEAPKSGFGFSSRGEGWYNTTIGGIPSVENFRKGASGKGMTSKDLQGLDPEAYKIVAGAAEKAKLAKRKEMSEATTLLGSKKYSPEEIKKAEEEAFEAIFWAYGADEYAKYKKLEEANTADITDDAKKNTQKLIDANEKENKRKQIEAILKSKNIAEGDAISASTDLMSGNVLSPDTLAILNKPGIKEELKKNSTGMTTPAEQAINANAAMITPQGRLIRFNSEDSIFATQDIQGAILKALGKGDGGGNVYHIYGRADASTNARQANIIAGK